MKRITLAFLLPAALAGIAAGGLQDENCPPDLSVPEVIEVASEAGAVSFPHELHAEGLEVPCDQCHHETRAGNLDVPHPEYFQDLWKSCSTCHKETETSDCPGACSDCHHDSPAGIADETLSSKVVIHRSCWQCHEVGTGAEASTACELCHQPPPVAPEAEKGPIDHG